MNNTNINIIGYYNHSNIGDEQYKQSFKYIFKNCNLNFIDCDIIDNMAFNEKEPIILGGGDILSPYFLTKINNKFKNCNNKIIAVSVGLPYNETLITTDLLDIIDYIFIRTKQDNSLFEYFYDKNKVYYLPDIFLYNYNYNIYINNFTIDFGKILHDLEIVKKTNKKIIGITLNRHIYKEIELNNYNLFVKSMASFCNDMIFNGYFLLFIPFNTNIKNKYENDILIHNDIVSEMKYKHNFININCTTLSSDQIYKIYDYTYFNICMRFHACLYSIKKCIPFIPIYTTKKIKNLLLDINYNIHYECKTNENFIPIDFHCDLLHNEYNKLITLYTDIKTSLKKLIFDFSNVYKLKSLLNSNYTKNNSNKIKKLIDLTLSRVNNFKSIYTDVNDKTKQEITQIVTYSLIGSCNSIYNYGLFQKMFNNDYNYNLEWRWIIKDNYKNNKNFKLPSKPNGLFNLTYIDQSDHFNNHRSGWQYVYDNLTQFHNEDSNLYLDLYIDRTFHWNCNVNKFLNIIPYTKPWIGFLHHTFNTTFSSYNNETLFKNELFIKSLKYCKGIFVLSNYLKKQVINRLKKLNINVNVYALIHPTDTNCYKFTYNKFLNNYNPQILSIGGWLRNILSFYNLHLNPYYNISKNIICKKQIKFTKTAIKCSNMSNYYPDSDELDIHNNCNIITQGNVSCGNEHNWYKHFKEYYKNIIKSVNTINKLDNNVYDDLLTCNIVFLNLIDASAVNTVIECIVRSTPIIINKIEPIVELLGEDYPMYYINNNNYYEMNKEINNLLKNSNIINKTYKYLEKIDKTKFTIKYFIKNFISELQN